MYLCIYVFTYLRIYVFMYLCIYVFMYLCIYVFMYLCIYVFMYLCIYVIMYSSRVGTFRHTTGEVRSKSSCRKVKFKGQPRQTECKLKCHQARGNRGEFD